MEKDIINVDAIARKLGPASIKTINDRLEITRQERWKREEMIERQEAEAMAGK